MLGGGKFPLLYPFHRQGEHTFVYEAGNEVLLVHHHHSVLGRWSSPPLRWRNTTPGTSNCTDTYSQLTSTQTHNLKCTHSIWNWLCIGKSALVFVQLKIRIRIATVQTKQHRHIYVMQLSKYKGASITSLVNFNSLYKLRQNLFTLGQKHTPLRTDSAKMF